MFENVRQFLFLFLLLSAVVSLLCLKNGQKTKIKKKKIKVVFQFRFLKGGGGKTSPRPLTSALTETFKQQEEVLGLKPSVGLRPPVPPCGATSTLQHTSAALIRWGLRLWSERRARIRSERPAHVAPPHRTWNYDSKLSGGLCCRAWTAVYGQSECPPLVAPPHHYGVIAKSGPHKASECWPRPPTGAGRWTRSCAQTTGEQTAERRH